MRDSMRDDESGDRGRIMCKFCIVGQIIKTRMQILHNVDRKIVSRQRKIDSIFNIGAYTFICDI